MRSRRRRGWRFGLGTLLVVAVGFAAEEDGSDQSRAPAAVVSDVDGEVQAELPMEGEVRRVERFDWLPVDTRLSAVGEAKLVLVFRTGARYQLGPGGTLTIGEEAPLQGSEIVERLPNVPAIPQVLPVAGWRRSPEVSAVRIRSASLRGLYPQGEARAVASRTVLRFERPELRGPYSLMMENRDGEVVFEARTEAVAVAVPAHRLERGERYYWRVEVVDALGVRHRGEAYFDTLRLEEEEALEAWRRFSGTDGSRESLGLLVEVECGLGLFWPARERLRAAVELGGEHRGVEGSLAAVEAWLERL